MLRNVDAMLSVHQRVTVLIVSALSVYVLIPPKSVGLRATLRHVAFRNLKGRRTQGKLEGM